MKGVIERHCH